MTQKDIRDIIQTQPFQPFRLHLADGKSMRIPHSDFILASPSVTVIADEMPGSVPGEISLVPYEHIVRVEMLPRKPRKTTA